MRARDMQNSGGKTALATRLVRLLLVTAPLTFAGPALGAGSPLVSAARNGDAAGVLELVKGGADVNAAANDGSTALLWATYNSQLDTVKALLAAGADVNAANHYGITPLLQASRTGDAAIIEALLAGGADVTLAHPDGETALMAASHVGRVDAINQLLAHGADPNTVDSFKQESPLMWAAAEGHLEAVDALLKAGADPNLKARVNPLKEHKNADFPTGGFTALMWATRNGYEDVVRRLIDAGADLSLTNGDGLTAMAIAVVNDRLDLAATLLDLGADANDGSLYQAVVMHDGTTDWYAHDGSRLWPNRPNQLTALDLIKRLLDAGADPNKPFVGELHSAAMCCDPYSNASPFYRAAVAADVAALKLMIEHGADVAWMPSKVDGGGPGANANVGRPAIFAAVNGGRGVPPSGGPGNVREGAAPPFREASDREPAHAVKVLLEAGANPNAAAPDGATALHEAAKLGKLDVIRALAEGGAKLDALNGDGLTALDLAEGRHAKDAGKKPPPVAPPPKPDASPKEVAALLRELMQQKGVPIEPHGVPMVADASTGGNHAE